MRDRDHDDDRSDHTPANKHGAEESGRVDQTVDGVYKNAAHNKIEVWKGTPNMKIGQTLIFAIKS